MLRFLFVYQLGPNHKNWQRPEFCDAMRCDALVLVPPLILGARPKDLEISPGGEPRNLGRE